MHNYTAPKYQAKAFTCPICLKFSNQTWYYEVKAWRGFNSRLLFMVNISVCDFCKKYSIWSQGRMIVPMDSGIAPPNPLLRPEIKKLYNEARQIVPYSPRGAAALLRLALEQLCNLLKLEGRDLNQKIEQLSKHGLPKHVIQSLHLVRVIGNNAVHPGHIDFDEKKETALKLFQVLNIICEFFIDAVYVQNTISHLPENIQQVISKRK